MSRWKLFGLLLLVVVVAVIAWRVLAPKPSAQARRPMATATIAVTAVPAITADVPVYLTALGTVQASNTVAVTAQIGGQLQALHFVEGGEVKKGDLLATVDPRTYQAALDQALAKKRQDAAQLIAARSTLSRYEDLIEKKFVAAQDLENQRQTVRQQEALLAADDAAISSARTQLSFTRITAPFDGLAGIRQVDVGNLVQANSSIIVVLTQTQPINVIFTLPQQDMERVRSADAPPLPVTAMSRSDGTPVAEGQLTVIDNTIDTSTATFRLKAEFANDDKRLWPGEFVNIRLQVRTVKNGLVVPATGVQQGPDGEFAWVVQDDNSVQARPLVSAGQVEGGGVLVASGLVAGERVVTEGAFRLKAGSKVQPLAPGEVPPATVEPASDGKPATPGRRG